jgi:glycine betaine/proline transport system substrate-binding protein
LIADPIVKLGVIYEPYCIWAAPDYSDGQLITVADLQKDEISANIEKTIYSINPGAGISRFSIEIMESYNLAATGFKLENLSEDVFFSYVEKSLEQRKTIIIPFWHPHLLH